MGAQLGNDNGYLSEINVTPFVDVMLVLLIIFMVTATVRHQGVFVELPRTVMVEALPVGKDHFVLTVQKDGSLFLDQLPVPRENLTDYLIQRVAKQRKKLYLRADAGVDHGTVVAIIGAAREAGVAYMAMVAEPEEGE